MTPWWKTHSWMVLIGAVCALSAQAAEPEAPPAPDGVRQVAPFALPVSEYLSPVARAHVQADVARADPLAKADNATLLQQLPGIRADTERWAEGVIAQLRTRYAVEVTRERWNDVSVLRVEPRTRTPEQAKRLLIELHGGGFVMGSAQSFGLMEAIPVAAMTGMTVVAVDYRMGPEHRFPAASEDVAAVYRAALKRYSPEHIGMFGCSAGGVLTGESLAWFAKERLPMPAAAGMFCAAGDARYRGDSRYVVAAVNDALLPNAAGELPIMEDLYYGDGVDFHDPLVSPVFSDAVLRQFPPTLLITATRAAELSAAAYTHSRLIDLGRESDLHVWDGLGHAFHLTETLPESQQALRVTARFFSRHLGLPVPAAAAPR
ncbi:alpha/beta hydrolase [Xanthomonas vesicatoria]|uniref:Alpha/beta hydrolase n=1 Tax=Xanthomonas vesicatoria TaxID=56460 RepID=A0AAJ0N2V5_9XANT|nr:alpha/beta hydrolase [Xanthomonas vesicatoria]APO95883.1 esterase [Xanthomonas vesicatoria]KHM92039.1 esterase [Xanthomonas vesicatoria]KHM94196.1 esterase [Xanthomonas vesicatoria]MCC8623697.1 alpha/beta hydrolase [Xanthomonas vesicatoria]MCC8695254.1 alpha/beta hydrolase [Xanthomonas vesicatoria]